MIRLTQCLTVLLVCAGLVDEVRAQDVPGIKGAQATFKQAARAGVASYRAELKATTTMLKVDLAAVLQEFADGETEAAELPAALADAYEAAYIRAVAANFAHVDQVDRTGSFLLEQLDLGAIPGLTLGDGGTLDAFHAGMRRELGKLDKKAGRLLATTLKKARKGLPEGGVLTCVTFPIPLLQFAEPGSDVDALPTGLTPRHPVLMSGYGDETTQTLAILGASSAGDPMLVNIYDADGNLLAESVPASAGVSANLYRLDTVVPEGAAEPHGNVRIEMHATGGGWDYGVGY